MYEYKERIEKEDERNDLLELKKVKILKKGIMVKKGSFMKNWKQRWFVLKSDKLLYYYETKTDIDSKKKIYNLKGFANLSKIKEIKKKGDKEFEIITPKRIWSFKCGSINDRNNWIDTIKFHIINK